MKHTIKHMRWVWAGLIALLAAVGCAKMDFTMDADRWYSDPMNASSSTDTEDLAIGTLRSQDGVRYVKLDEKTCSQVMNPNSVADIPDGTRIFLGFRYVVSEKVASFCTDAILVEWATPIDTGDVSILDFEECFSPENTNSRTYTDPVDIVADWMTSLEDGFLTLHYKIPQSGDKKHSFSVYRSMDRSTFYLVHDADGDKGPVSEGIVCFDLSHRLPDTEGETVKLSLVYIDLNNTEKRLTVEYRSPK